jgi:hypothetical protein
VEFPTFDNIRKITVGDLKDGMSYLVNGFQRGGKVKITRIVPFDELAYHTTDEVLMLSIFVKDTQTDVEYKWFDLSLREVSKIEYFESSK